MQQQIVKRIGAQEMGPLSPLDIQDQVNVIQRVMGQVMSENVHYGKIPGTKSPSLFKAGAEKIMLTFRLSSEAHIDDLSTPDVARYRIKVRLTSPSGLFVGEGIGECSSNEEKYKWRAAVNANEFEATAHGRKRKKWKKGYGNYPDYELTQVRTDSDDLANTVLKMAKKRALVDAVLTATAASDCFTQDIEDLPPEYFNQSDQKPQQQEPTQTEFYPEGNFNKNFSRFKKAILEHGKTPEEMIITISAKAPLTDHQKQKLHNIKKGQS